MPAVHQGNGRWPIVLSVPHSGRGKLADLAPLAHGGKAALMALEDPLVDALVEPLVRQGFAAVIAKAPRAAIDCNRALDELDPLCVEGASPPPAGSRAAQGLGLIPSRSHRQPRLWKRPLSRAQLDLRIARGWTPYHDALTGLLGSAAARHGGAILIDCHSMPPRRRGLPRIVLGDRHGTSAAPWVSRLAAQLVKEVGEECGFNHPYAGGHITACHGAPSFDVHALQVEIDRAAYLDASLTAPGPGMGRMRLLFSRLAHGLAEGWMRAAAE